MPEEPEVPICRVCRSEGTAEEPLFYPCRCSGSIKYVHQVCLEEWLAHSNKKFCELCGYEYAFSPLYDPSMPESIPKRLIVRQMLANVSMIMLQVIRTTVVLGMWGFMLPYVIYWITRVLIWFAQTAVYSLGSTDVFLNDYRNFDTTNMTSIAATANLRFKGYDTWRDWYVAFHNDTAVPPIASRTGVLNGANHVADVLYTGTQVCLRLSFQFLHSVLGVSVSEAQINDLVEVIVELAAKCFEGSVIVVLSLVIFFILFILRDWVVTNAPLEEDFGEAAVEEHPDEFAEAAAAEADVDAEAVVPNNDDENNNINNANNGDNAAGVPAVDEQANPAVPNNHAQIQGQPIFAEGPQPQQPFEQPGFDLPLLDDIPPDERPVRQHRRRLPERQPFAAGEALRNNNPVEADGRSDTDSDGSGMSDEFQMLARGLINRAMTAVETHDAAANGHDEHHSVQRSNTWSYADEVYEEQSDAGSGRSDIYSASMSSRIPAIEVDIEDAVDNAASESSSSTSHLRPAASDDDRSSWSFMAGETLGSRNASSSNPNENGTGDDSGSSRNAESLPPVFTSETSRVIPARADSDGEPYDDAENMGDDAEQEHRIEPRPHQLQTQAGQLARGNGLFGVEDRQRMHETFVAARRHTSGSNTEAPNQAEDEAPPELSDILLRPEAQVNHTQGTVLQELHNLQDPQLQEENRRNLALDLEQELDRREQELVQQGRVMDSQEWLRLREQHIKEWQERQEQRIMERLRLQKQQILEEEQRILQRQREEEQRIREWQREQEQQIMERLRLREQQILEEQQEEEQRILERLQEEQQLAPPGDRNPEIPDIEADIPPALGQNNVGANGDDFDENFGDFEAADGVLEAMGLRGPFFNAVQYFMLLFMVVVAVLVVCAWIPLVLGRMALTFSPLRYILYVIHFNLSMVYTVTKLVLAMLAPPLWKLIHSGLISIDHVIDGPTAVSTLPILSLLKPIVLSGRNFSAKAAALGKFLTSPEAEGWFEEPIHRLLASVGSHLPMIGPALDIEQLSHKTTSALANFFAGMASSDIGTTYIEDFTNSRLVADPTVDLATNMSLFQPAWTYMGKFLHELDHIKQWEQGVWASVAGWDARIVRLADYLREISRGLTFADRFTLIVLGILICVFLAWHTVHTTPPDMRHKAHYQFSRMILMMAKIVFFVVIEIVMFPMLCGYCMDISLTPLLPEADRSSHYWAILNNSLSRRAVFWLLGLLFMIHFARFVAYCRQVMRPGLLWFIRDPNDA
ncbi:hypothetical protein LPJ53_005778, partial [Coemansia erecta]